MPRGNTNDGKNWMASPEILFGKQGINLFSRCHLQRVQISRTFLPLRMTQFDRDFEIHFKAGVFVVFPKSCCELV